MSARGKMSGTNERTKTALAWLTGIIGSVVGLPASGQEDGYYPELDVKTHLQSTIDEIGIDNIPFAVIVDAEGAVMVLADPELERIALGVVRDEELNLPGTPGLFTQYEKLLNLVSYSCTVITRCKKSGGTEECDERHIPPGCTP